MNARSMITVALPALAAIALATSAGAAITGVTGQCFWLGSPPIACGPTQLVWTNGFASAWDEQQNRPQALTVDMVNNPGVSTSPTPGTLNGVFDSHFIHFEGIPGIVNCQGTVTFNNPIVGVIFTPTNLDNSDALCGSFGTSYPTAYPFRGLNATPQSTFSINANVLTFSLWAIQPTNQIDQIRVLTAVPAPGVLGAVASAGLVGLRRRR